MKRFTKSLIVSAIAASSFFVANISTAESSVLTANATEWTDEAKQANPIGYIQLVLKPQLASQQIDLKNAIAKIHEGMLPLQKQIDIYAQEVHHATTFLEEGRKLYQIAQEKAKTDDINAIKFVNRTYPDLQTFYAQLEFLYQERQTKEGLLQKARDTQAQLQSELNRKMMELAKANMAISQLPAQIAMLQAIKNKNQLVQAVPNVDEFLEKATSIFDCNTNYPSESAICSGENSIGTTKDLMQSARNGTPPVYVEFENFLKNGASLGTVKLKGSNSTTSTSSCFTDACSSLSTSLNTSQ